MPVVLSRTEDGFYRSRFNKRKVSQIEEIMPKVYYNIAVTGNKLSYTGVRRTIGHVRLS